jgi:hypothetical protein
VAGPLVEGNRAGEYLPLKNNNIVINDLAFFSIIKVFSKITNVSSVLRTEQG